MNANRCGACGGGMIGSHYHEPTCPGCGADLVDGIGSDADDDCLGLDDDGRTHCVACGQVDHRYDAATQELRRRQTSRGESPTTPRRGNA